MINREFCLQLLKEYTQSESLLKHAYSVETCVVAYARKFGEDEVYWGNVALLHDFDYERFPTAEDHPYRGAEILRVNGFDEEFIATILSHATYTGVIRDTLLKKVLFACDELAGFLTAVAYVQPDKKVASVKGSSVKKKLKDRSFAKSVSREDIYEGCKLLNIELDEHISFCINALSENE